MENVKLKILDSQNIYGTMNSGSISLKNITTDDREMLIYKYGLKPEDIPNHELTKDDKQQIFTKHRRDFATVNNFDYNKMFMADQVDKCGTWFKIDQDYVDANPKGWSDIRQDILIITDKMPGVAIGHPVADCPVVIMEDRKQGITAIGHCSAELIDKKMPMMIADALNSSSNTKDEDILVTVGPLAGSDWTYDCWPRWAQDMKMWEDCIIEENGIYRINLSKVIRKQLLERNIKESNTTYSSVDTITDDRYYSNSAGRANPAKQGRQFVGAIYQKTR